VGGCAFVLTPVGRTHGSASSTGMVSITTSNGCAWPGGFYHFVEYIADLDGALEILSPQEPVRIVGHSLGAAAALIYAALRPGRVSHLTMMDAVPLSISTEEIPARLASYLEDLRHTPRKRRRVESIEDGAQRLVRNNPRSRKRRRACWRREASRPIPSRRTRWPGNGIPSACALAASDQRAGAPARLRAGDDTDPGHPRRDRNAPSRTRAARPLSAFEDVGADGPRDRPPRPSRRAGRGSKAGQGIPVTVRTE